MAARVFSMSRSGIMRFMPVSMLSILVVRIESRTIWSFTRRAESGSHDMGSRYIRYSGSDVANTCPSAERMLPRVAAKGLKRLSNFVLTAIQ